MENNKKSFYSSTNSRRKTKENVCPLPNVLRDLVTKDKVPLNVFFASVFTGRRGLQES